MTTVQAASSPIQSGAKKCLELFDALVALPHQPDDQPNQDLSAAEAVDCLGRFKIWAGNLGAFQNLESKSSLDYRLRDASKISAQIVELLGELSESIEDACMIVSNARANRTASLVEARAGDLTTMINGPDDETTAQTDDEEVSEIREIFESITDAINNLFRLSMIIRNNTSQDRYAKAAAAARNVPFDDRPDISHVEHKFPSLKTKGKRWLTARLGKAITQRRQYLRYCREHHDKIARGAQSEPRPNLVPLIEPKNEVGIGLSPDARSAFSKPTSTLAPTQASTLLLTTDQVPEEDPLEDSQSQTSYATSKEEESSSSKLTVIKLEDVSEGLGHFECPYCWQIQASRTRNSWKKHVLSDLKPYVCTYEKCELKLFPDHNTWFSHELKDHRREYRCYFCSHIPFDDSIDYQNHLKHRHPQSFVEDQLPSLLEMSQRPIVKVSPAECPFCDDWEKRLRDVNTHIPLSETLVVTPSQFKHHVGAHMEQLALFAIPRGYTEDGEADSGNAAQDAGSRGSSLAISAPDSKTAQDLRACEELLTAMMESDAYQELPESMELRAKVWSISGKLGSGQYLHASDFIKDMRRSFPLKDPKFPSNIPNLLVTQLEAQFKSFWSARHQSTLPPEEHWKRWRAKRIRCIPESEMAALPAGDRHVLVTFNRIDGGPLSMGFDEFATVDDLYAYMDCHEFLDPSEMAVDSEPQGYEHEYQFSLRTDSMRSLDNVDPTVSIMSLTKTTEDNRFKLRLDILPFEPRGALVKDGKGKSKISIAAEAESSEAGDTKASEQPNLRLTLIAAQDRDNSDLLLSLFPNSFARVRIDGKEVAQTTVYKRNGFPYWNESFDVKVTEDGFSTITVELFNEKRFAELPSADPQFLGLIEFRVGDFIDMVSGGTQIFTRDLQTSEMYQTVAVKGSLSLNLTTDLRIPLVNRRPQYALDQVLNQAQPADSPGSGQRASAVNAEDALEILNNSTWRENTKRDFTPPPYNNEQGSTDNALHQPIRKLSTSSQYSLSFAAADTSETLSETIDDDKPNETPKGGLRYFVSKAFSEVGIDRKGKVPDETLERDRHLPAASRIHENERPRIVDSCFSKKRSDGSLTEIYITHIRVTEDVANISSPPPSDSTSRSTHTKKVRFIIIAQLRFGQVRIHKARENSNGTFSIGETWNMDNLVAIKCFGAEGSDTPAEGFTLFLNEPRYWEANTAEEKWIFIQSLILKVAQYTKGNLPELIDFDSVEQKWALRVAAKYHPDAADQSQKLREGIHAGVERPVEKATEDTHLATDGPSSRSPLYQDAIGGTCVLCRKAVELNGVRTVPCEHTFHESCLKPWQLKRNSCPHCGTSLPPGPPPVIDKMFSKIRFEPGAASNLPNDSAPSSSIVVQKAGNGGVCPVCRLDYAINADVLIYSCGKHAAHVECGGQSRRCPECAHKHDKDGRQQILADEDTAIQTLNSAFVDKAKIENDPEYWVCDICREGLGDGNYMHAVTCGHKFHGECVEQGMYTSYCPICYPAGPTPSDSRIGTGTGDIAEDISSVIERPARSSTSIPAPPRMRNVSWSPRTEGNQIEAESWQAHISLLPSSSQSSPFVKRTTPYKRCLSRGLIRMITISDSDAPSFVHAVDSAFSEALQGRMWNLLFARPDKDQGQGSLPMLRQLPEAFDHHQYHKEFLRQNCAVADAGNNYLDLYIVLSHDTLSWSQIRNLTPFAPALENDPNIESCWRYDPILDGNDESLLVACRTGAFDVVKQRLEDTPEDLNATDSRLRTPLHLACTYGYTDIVKLLLKRGCDINSVNAEGNTPLHLACRKDRTDIVKLLLDRGCDVNSVNAKGDTPLYRACHNGQVDIVKLFLERDCNVDSVNVAGNTPLHTAIEKRNVEIVRMLLGSGADFLQFNSRQERPLDQLTRLEKNGIYDREDAAQIREIVIAAMRGAKEDNLDIERRQSLDTSLIKEDEAIIALQEAGKLKQTEAERISRETETQPPKAGEAPISFEDLASQWPLDRFTSWMASNGFSRD